MFADSPHFARISSLRRLFIRISVLGIACAVPLLLLVAQHTARAAGPGPVLVVVAHPDDEALQMSGVMASAKAAGKQVYLAILTNGDGGGAELTGGSYCGIAPGAGADAARLSLVRDKESMDAMSLLPNGGLAWTNSVSTSHIFFLGYPDTHLTDVASNASSTPIQTDKTGLHHTFARSGAGANDCTGDFGTLKRGVASPYTAAALAGDMDALIAQVKPTDIYTHSTFEGHTDHREVARQVAAAVIRSHLAITVHGTLIHPEGSDGCSVQSNYQWPNPSGSAATNPDLRATPTLPFTAPPAPAPQPPGCAIPGSTTPNWGPAGPPTERVAVPASMTVTTLANNLKYQMINTYVSQHGCSVPSSPNCGFLRGFVKNEEIFWTQGYGTGTPVPYKETVLGTTGLKSYWRFDDTSGVVARAAAGTQNATYKTVDLGVAGLLTGDANPAASFPGASNGAEVGDVYDFAGNGGHEPFSLEAWVKPAAVDASVRRIFSKELANAQGDQGYFLANSTAGLKFYRQRDASDVLNPAGYQVLAAPAVPANTTSYVAVTDDGITMRMYVNGAMVAASPDGVALLDTSAPLTIGAKAGGGIGAFGGVIDEPAVYNTALSPAVVNNHYLSGKGIAGPPDLVAPGTPATPTATAGDGSATINLSPLNAEADLASYTLERKLASAGAAAWAPVRTGVTIWPLTDTGLTNGTAYQYRVIAIDASANSSPPSAAVSVTPGVATLAPAPGSGSSTAPPAKDRTKPRVKVSIAKRLARASAFKRGLRIKVSASEACTITTQLVIDPAKAKKLHISRIVGTRKVKFTKSGSKTITVKLTKKAVKALRRHGKTTISIRTKATDTAGNISRLTTKTVLR